VSHRILPSSEALRELAARDPRLGRAMEELPPFPGFPDPERGGSHFHALARAILFQQLATRAASTIHARVLALTPGPRFATPARFLQLSDEVVRGAGVSRAKLAAIRDLAERAVDGRLPLRRIALLPDNEVVERMVEVRGIGAWTARMFLLFRLGRLDVLAPDDLGIREGLRRLDGLGERPTPAAVLARGEVWRPLRSVASWVLWRILEFPDPQSPGSVVGDPPP
jgi:DNA-3-methyladenine glycosylase II